MKKYISLIGALALSSTASLSVIACGPATTSDNEEKLPVTPGTENIKQWSSQTSNIAKAIISSKNQNFNTNNLLNKTLNTINTNIEKNTDPNLGTSYDAFKNGWGYQGEIKGLTAADFNNDSASTIDNNQLASKDEIVNTLKTINETLSQVSGFASFLTSNSILAPALKLPFIKDKLVAPLWSLSEGLKGNNEIIQTIKTFGPMITTLINNLGGFNPEVVLGDFYKEGNINESLFGKNGNDGWLNNYKSFGSFTSEAISENSEIIKDKNLFTSWDEVALFKTSIDLNGLIYQWSNGKLTLGKIFENAIDYDQATNKVKSIDFTKIANQIATIWTTSPENIINLISTLIPVIKTQFLNMNPSTPITKIATNEATDPEKGIINLGDIIKIVKDVILNKDGFSKFISDLFFPEDSGKLKQGNYATLDFTCYKKSLSEVIRSSKSEILTEVENLYTNLFEPLIEKFSIREICNQIEEILGNWTKNNKTAINLSDVQGVAKIINNEGLFNFLNHLSTYKSQAELSSDWMNLWTLLGIQDPKKEDFKKDSVLAQLAETIKANKDILKNFEQLTNLAIEIVPNVMNTIIDSQTTNVVNSIKNEANWSIDETTVMFDYNTTVDETTIVYNLTDKINNKTYQILIVVKGNADTPLGTKTKQVWLKSLKEVK